MKRVLSGIAVALLMTTQAAAAELVTTAGAAKAAAPQIAAPAAVPPLGVSTGQVADDQPGPAPRPGEAGCRPAGPATDADRQMHGEVWAGAGTHGYRDVGTAMTAPVGRCGSVSIAIDRAQGSFGGWRR